MLSRYIGAHVSIVCAAPACQLSHDGQHVGPAQRAATCRQAFLDATPVTAGRPLKGWQCHFVAQCLCVVQITANAARREAKEQSNQALEALLCCCQRRRQRGSFCWRAASIAACMHGFSLLLAAAEVLLHCCCA